jgi:hypothetical protein
MTTVVKPKNNQVSLQSVASKIDVKEEGLTVEKYLEQQFEEMIKVCLLLILVSCILSLLQDFKSHTQSLISKLREDYKQTETLINSSLNKSTETEGIPIVVTLKCIAGPHTGQKFRLESSNVRHSVFSSSPMMQQLI